MSRRYQAVRTKILFALVVGLQVLSSEAYACSWANGYFRQVSRLRGIVVGVNNGDWRHPFRWARQRVPQRDVKMILCEHRWPVKDWKDLPIVKVVNADRDGRFDFGVLPHGHYRLRIEAGAELDTWFDVEIAPLPKRIDSVLIDVSPVHPDCTGGHEFIPVHN